MKCQACARGACEDCRTLGFCCECCARVLHWCSWGPCSGLIDEDEPKVLTEDGFMHPRCADEALEART